MQCLRFVWGAGLDGRGVDPTQVLLCLRDFATVGRRFEAGGRVFPIVLRWMIFMIFFFCREQKRGEIEFIGEHIWSCSDC